jgi:hypothetical protein
MTVSTGVYVVDRLGIRKPELEETYLRTVPLWFVEDFRAGRRLLVAVVGKALYRSTIHGSSDRAFIFHRGARNLTKMLA